MLKITTVEEFVYEINQIIRNDACTVIEAICEYAETNDIDYNKLVPFINASFKNAIIREAERKNVIKKPHDQLPL